MKAYRRWNPQGEQFFVDDHGRIVTESQARSMGIVESSSGSVLRESTGRATVTKPASQQKSIEKRLVEAFRGLGLNKKEAKAAAKHSDRR